MHNSIWLIILLCLITPFPLQGTVDNYSVFIQLTEKIAQQIAHIEHLHQHHKILLKNADPHGENGWFVENNFIRIFNQSGYDSIALYQNSANVFTTPDSVLIIEFKIIELKVNYSSENRFWKIGAVNRHIRVDLWLKAYNFNTGFIMWSNSLSETYTDKIDAKQTSELHHKHIAFTQSPIPVSGYKKYVEPIFIMGLSGTIIYLFYSFRSN